MRRDRFDLLAVLRERHEWPVLRLTEIFADRGWTATEVYNALRVLRTDGLAVNVDHGWWAAVQPVREKV